jgi:hypothetical protein
MWYCTFLPARIERLHSPPPFLIFWHPVKRKWALLRGNPSGITGSTEMDGEGKLIFIGASFSASILMKLFIVHFCGYA